MDPCQKISDSTEKQCLRAANRWFIIIWTWYEWTGQSKQLFVWWGSLRNKERQIRPLYSNYDQHAHKEQELLQGSGDGSGKCMFVCVCVCVVLTSGCGPQGEGSDAEGGHRTHHQVTDRWWKAAEKYTQTRNDKIIQSSRFWLHSFTFSDQYSKYIHIGQNEQIHSGWIQYPFE